MATLSNRGSFRSNKGPEAEDRKELAAGKAERREHTITEAVAATQDNAGLAQGDKAKRQVEESDGS